MTIPVHPSRVAHSSMRVELIIAFFAGLYTQHHLAEPISLAWSIALLPLAAIWGLSAKNPTPNPRLSRLLGVAFCLVAGVVWTAFRADNALSTRIDTRLVERPLDLTGTIVSIPKQTHNRWTFEVDVDRLAVPSDLEPAPPSPKRVRLSWRQTNAESLPPPRVGQRWAWTVRLKPTRGAQNPHRFDAEIRSLQTGIGAFGSVISRQPAQPIDSFVVTPKTVVNRLREAIDRRIRSDPLLTETAPLVSALSIGDQSALTDEHRRIFAATGTSHLISISGLHISAVSLLTAGFGGWVWRRNPRRLLTVPAQKIAAALGAATAIAFAAVAGLGVPVQRAALMVVTACLLLYSGRSLSGMVILAQAMLVVVVFDPWAPLFPGFWLSFGSVALIIAAVGQRRRADSKTPSSEMSGPLARPARRFRETLRIQAVVTVAMIPMSWWFFQQISIVSLLANVIAIPLVSLIIVPMTLVTAVVPLAPLTTATDALLRGLLSLLNAMAQWPFAALALGKPPLWTVLLAVAGLTGWLVLTHRLRWLCWLGFLPLLLWRPTALAPGDARVVIFDVGQGNAALVQTRRHRLIVDAGPHYPGFPSPAKLTIAPYLRAEGVDRLDGILITHQDNDHAGGLGVLTETVDVGWVMSPEALSTAVRQVPCRAPKSWIWDGVRFEVLYPTDADLKRFERPNDRSCLLKVSTAGGSLLFTGDLGAAPLTMLARASGHERLKSDVLVAPHHGAKTTSPSAFVERTDPAHVIFSAGYRNRYRHPNEETVERYRQHNATVWRTDQHGAILIDMGKDAPSISAWRTVGRRYWWH